MADDPRSVNAGWNMQRASCNLMSGWLTPALVEGRMRKSAHFECSLSTRLYYVVLSVASLQYCYRTHFLSIAAGMESPTTTPSEAKKICFGSCGF